LKPIDLFEGEKDDYPRTREWALWIWQNMPYAQRLRWMSKLQVAAVVPGDWFADRDVPMRHERCFPVQLLAPDVPLLAAQTR